jgi:hypothetical protein
MASKDIYTRKSRERKFCLQLADPSMAKTERIILSLDVPEILNLHRPLTDAEQEQSGYIKLADEQVRLQSKAGQRAPAIW